MGGKQETTGHSDQPIILEEYEPYACLAPKLTGLEREALKEDIACNGLNSPIDVLEYESGRFRILDGHNRYSILRELERSLSLSDIRVIPTNDPIDYIVRVNLHRRHLYPYARYEMALPIRDKFNGRHGGDRRSEEFSRPEISGLEGESNDLFGATIGLSGDAVVMCDYIALNADGETKEKLRRGEKKIHGIWSMFKKKEAQNQDEQDKTNKLSESKYQPIMNLSSFSDWLHDRPNCDLLLTDPLYMPDLKEPVYDFANSWLCSALNKVKPTGRAYVFIGSYPEELYAYLKVWYENSSEIKTVRLVDVLVWTYENTLGPEPSDYKRNWVAVLYFRGLNAQALNSSILSQRWSVQRINAPDARSEVRYHTWQKPDEIARRFIKQSTDEGAVVYDCFAGTGTFLVQAALLNRRAYGCDTDPKMIEIAKRRGIRIE